MTELEERDKPKVAIEKTPQGQFVSAAPEVTLPGLQHNLFGHGWGTWLGNPHERYGYLVSSQNIPMTVKLEMLKDEVLALCVAFSGAMLVKARREIHCADAAKQRFFEAMFREWEQEFILQANVGIALGSIGMVKKWAFHVPEPQEVDAKPVWTKAAQPYVITGFDPLYPLGSAPRFDPHGQHFAGMDTPDGAVDVFYSLWLTFRQELAFGGYYGAGRLEQCYKQWWLKNFGADLYVVALQKQANRVVQASYPPGVDPASGKSNQEIALAVGDSVRSGATVAIPSNTYTTIGLDGEERPSATPKWALQFLEGAGSMQSFHEIDNHHDKKMSLGYFLPPQALLEVTGGQLGSVTSAAELSEIATELLMQDAADIDRHLNQYVFPAISAANFPPDSPRVIVRTTGLAADNSAMLMEVIKALIGEHPDAAYFDMRAALERLQFPLKSEAQVKKEKEAAEKEKAQAQPPAAPPATPPAEEAATPAETTEDKAAPATPKEAVPAPGVKKEPVGAEVDEFGRIQPEGSPLDAWPDRNVPLGDEDAALAVEWWKDFAPVGMKGLLDAVDAGADNMLDDADLLGGYGVDDTGGEWIELGGPGSGNWAHVGRPGFLGGSAPRNKGMTIAKGQDWLDRYERVAGKPHPLAEEIRKGRKGTKAERLESVNRELIAIDQRRLEIQREKNVLKQQYGDRKLNVLQYRDAVKDLDDELDKLVARHKELVEQRDRIEDEPDDAPEPKPEPEPEPKPENKIEGKPAGTPVDKALITPGKGRLASVCADTLDAINSVHGDGNLPTIPVKSSTATKTFWGKFRHTYSGQALDITVSTKIDEPEITLTHEIGHFLDHSGFGKGGFLSQQALFHGKNADRKTVLGAMFEVMNRIKNSAAVQQLQDMRRNPSKYQQEQEFTYANGKYTATVKPDKSYIGYLLKTEESWARAYAQYIATRSGNATMRQQITADREGMHGAKQWTDDDFTPIAEAIDNLFVAAGWIK